MTIFPEKSLNTHHDVADGLSTIRVYATYIAMKASEREDRPRKIIIVRSLSTGEEGASPRPADLSP